MFAHFYNGRKGTYQLLISKSADISFGIVATYLVAGKREARKIAKDLGATCWNF